MGLKASRNKLSAKGQRIIRAESRYVRRMALSERRTRLFLKRRGFDLFADKGWIKVFKLNNVADRKRMIKVIMTIPETPLPLTMLEQAYGQALAKNIKSEVSNAEIKFPEVALTVQPSDGAVPQGSEAPDQKAVHDGESAPAPSPEVTA